MRKTLFTQGVCGCLKWYGFKIGETVDTALSNCLVFGIAFNKLNTVYKACLNLNTCYLLETMNKE